MIRLVLFLSLLAAFPPLATDMYLPAIPTLVRIWDQPLSMVNLTLVLFFVVYCIFILIYGPLSDKYGRRPPLMSGILIYIFSCFLCAASFNVYFLIIARMLQAAGAASASSIALAIAKDRLPSHKREKVLSYIAVIIALAPMLAPMIGSLVMVWFSWQWIFILQAVWGIIALSGVFFMEESNLNPADISFRELTTGFSRILRNRNFSFLMACFSILSLPLFAFIASSSFIYITCFNVSETGFAVYFGMNAIFLMAGSYTCARFGSRIGTIRMITLGILGGIAGGILLLFKIASGPMQIMIPMAIISFAFGMSRPPSNNLMLEQVSKNTGTASSLMIFSYFITGAVSMAVVSLEWPDKVFYLGALASLGGVTAFILWHYVKSERIIDVQ